MFNRYLDILGLAKRQPSLEALTEIVRAQLGRIPFENISKLHYFEKSGSKSIPDFRSFIEGIERYHFGGTCYSSNYYLNELLKYLGYDIRLCGADMANPDGHIVSIVTLGGRDFLVDVGYGAPFLSPLPLNLSDDHRIAWGDDEYVLLPRDGRGHSELQLYRGGALKHRYSVKPEAREISEFNGVIEDSYGSSATFMNAILLTRFERNSSIRIHNHSLIESRDGEFRKVAIHDREELIARIVHHFHMPEDMVRTSVRAVSSYGDAWS